MQLPAKVAESLGDRVLLNKPVARVEETEDLVTVSCTDGDTYKVQTTFSTGLNARTVM
jgi:monoamine oxidase